MTADHESTLKKTMIDDDVCTHDVIVGTNSTGTPTSEAQKLISSSSVTSIQVSKSSNSLYSDISDYRYICIL